jgi:hypothetical protein
LKDLFFPFLNKGITLACFQIDGNVPDLSDRLNIEVKAGVITSLASFSRRALILSRPMALLGLSFFIVVEKEKITE